MKLTIQRLKRLIREELEKVMETDDNAERERMKKVIGKEVQKALGEIDDKEPEKAGAERDLIVAYSNEKDPKAFAKKAYEIFGSLYVKLYNKAFNADRFLKFLENSM